jgi:DNA-binding LacI/PurR family transcriptional regulator
MYQVVSLKDIASEAGCSVNTVSLALKNSRRISTKNRVRIQQIAEQLNYVSNNIARALVLKKTGIIGLIIRSISSQLLTSEAWYIEQYLEQKGYTMYMVASHDDPKAEERIINLMLSNGMDGIIINTSMTDNLPLLEKLRAQGLPVVLLSGFEQVPAIDSVFPDISKGAYLVTKHLLAMGHKRVVHVTGERNYAGGNLKLHGFKQALTDAGIWDGDHARDNEFICCLEMRNPHVIDEKTVPLFISRAKSETAFFISDDELAIPLIKLLNKNSLRVPQDIAVTSIDNIRFAESCMVSLTSAGFDIQRISHEAVNMLINCIEGETKSGIFQNIKVEPELFIRESCGYEEAGGAAC